MNGNDDFAKTVLSVIAKGVALFVGVPLILAIGWLAWILILNAQKPSAADHKATIAQQAASKDEVTQWLRSKDIRFSDQIATAEYRDALLESKSSGLPTTSFISTAERNVNIPAELIPKVASVVTFTLTPRLEKFVLATSILSVILFYDQDGRLIFTGYDHSYQGM